MMLNSSHSIPERIRRLQATLPDSVTMVVATKYLPPEVLPTVFEANVRHFGESRVQDALEKQAQLPEAMLKDMTWHLIGHLQQNKVNKTVGQFGLIHSVDSVALLDKLSRANLEAGLIQPVLLQVNATYESQKHGVLPEGLMSFVEHALELPGISFRGLMGFGHPSREDEACRRVFARLQGLLYEVQSRFQLGPLELSMGMSHDYAHALEFGATIIRIGRLVLGELAE